MMNKFINSKNIPFLFKKSYSQAYEKIVKFSDDINNRELKIPVYEKTYSIIYSKDDKVSDFIKRVEGIDERLQKLEVYDFKGEKIGLEQNFIESAQKCFKIKINGYIDIKFFPSVNLLINNKNNSSHQILNNFNMLLYKNFADNKTPTEKSMNDFKAELDKNLTSILSTYEQLLDQYENAKKRLEKDLDKQTKIYINLGLLFFLLNVIVFYLLIYKFYGWDTIEPITYIVGNVYWIIALSFFVFKKKKLDFTFFYSDAFKRKFLKTKGSLLGYSEIERNFVISEIQEIKQFKEVISKI